MLDKFIIYLCNIYFGEIIEVINVNIFDVDLNWIDKLIDFYNDVKIIIDFLFGYEVGENLNLMVGVNNLLDVYLDEVDLFF